MVQGYAFSERLAHPNDVVMVLSDTYTFAQYWTEAFATTSTASMAGPQQMASATLYAFTGCKTIAGAIHGVTQPVSMPSDTMSPYYWDMDNATPSKTTDQSHHFAFYFAIGVTIPSAAQPVAVLGSIRQGKPQAGNYGDILLACTAASLGSQYNANPNLNFRTAFGVLKQTPMEDKTSNADTVSRTTWNASVHRAYTLLESNGLLK